MHCILIIQQNHQHHNSWLAAHPAFARGNSSLALRHEFRITACVHHTGSMRPLRSPRALTSRIHAPTRLLSSQHFDALHRDFEQPITSARFSIARTPRTPCISQHTRTALSAHTETALHHAEQLTPSTASQSNQYLGAHKSRVASRLLHRNSQVRLLTPCAAVSIAVRQRALATVARAFIAVASTSAAISIIMSGADKTPSLASIIPANAAHLDQVCKRPASALSLLACSKLTLAIQGFAHTHVTHTRTRLQHLLTVVHSFHCPRAFLCHRD
jgi:hypothetical protein